MSFLDRHAERADRYLESLLAADAAAGDVPADSRVDPEIRRAARLLRSTLVRVHPSFRFEERLAERLALAAAGVAVDGRAMVADGGERSIQVIPLPSLAPGRLGARGTGAPFGLSLGMPAIAVPSLAVPLAVPPNAVRPLVVGGALSLAGAAFLAWRRARPAGIGHASRPVATILAGALPGQSGRSA